MPHGVGFHCTDLWAGGRPRCQLRAARNIRAWQLERLLVPESSIRQHWLPVPSYVHLCPRITVPNCPQKETLKLQENGVTIFSSGGPAWGPGSL